MHDIGQLLDVGHRFGSANRCGQISDDISVSQIDADYAITIVAKSGRCRGTNSAGSTTDDERFHLSWSLTRPASVAM